MEECKILYWSTVSNYFMKIIIFPESKNIKDSENIDTSLGTCSQNKIFEIFINTLPLQT